jgi:hypothetical protein
MTSFRQIEANRRNALRSTGPKTDGKQRSRGNALRHGLTAETVIDGLEDAEDYRRFQANVIADYDAQTAVERELVLRLASLLWPIRRVISIETDLLRIQAEIMRDRRTACGGAHRAFDTQIAPDKIEGWNEDPSEQGPEDTAQRRCESTKDSYLPMSVRDLTCCFLHLGNLDNGTSERLGRYNAALWKQTGQPPLLLHQFACGNIPKIRVQRNCPVPRSSSARRSKVNSSASRCR